MPNSLVIIHTIMGGSRGGGGGVPGVKDTARLFAARLGKLSVCIVQYTILKDINC